jgi:putative hydrolase of the HAD superfamily
VSYRAVIFDLGGVVTGSPLHAIARFERETGLARGFIGRVIQAGGEQGTWSRLDRGELCVEEFHDGFARECEAQGRIVDVREMMRRIVEAAAVRPQMLGAIGRIRSRGLLAAALTNDWAGEGERTAAPESHALDPHFDRIFRSSVLGLRKPDPRIYRHTCKELGVETNEAIFLDDIGENLKSARALGLRTIKVVDPDDALAELEAALGFGLL